MKLNHRPSRVAFIDFETQSEEDLRKSTAHKYASHPSTRILTCVVKLQDGPTLTMGPYLQSEDMQLLEAIAESHTLVAHNAPFDAAVWEASGLPEAEWFDTLPCARAAGLPGKLDDLGTILTGRGKDKNGGRLIELLCQLKPGRPVPAVGPAHKLLLDYNRRDVELLEEVYGRVKDFGEPDVIAADFAVNQRGALFDRTRSEQLLRLYEENSEKLGAEFRAKTVGVNPNSPKQVREWLMSIGFNVDSIGKFAYKDLLADPEKFFVGDGEMDEQFELLLEAMELRREVVRVGKGKAEVALQLMESDGRVRDQFVYWGAHTGRWSGRALQLHNMPTGMNRELDVRDIELTYENVCSIARTASEKLGYRVLNADVLNACLRTLVRADNLLVADYGAVEARGVAYVSGDKRMLELYSDPSRSIYIDMGKQVFGRDISKKGNPEEYTLSKTLVLGCGYGMSGNKFELTCKSRGISTATFNKLGMKVGDAVKLYRETYPRVPQVWKEYHAAVHGAVEHGESRVAGRCLFEMRGRDLHAVLPSNRSIVYRNARIEMMVPGYCKLYGMPEEHVATVVYDAPRMGKRGFLYGGKVCENVVQGMCRDFLADAIVKAEQAGLKPMLHVHDELVCEVQPSRLKEFMEIMSVPPSWAPGFPLLAEGYSGPVWSKKTGGYEELNMLCGKAV